MSLKAFHLFFIAASIALCGVVVVWGVQSFRAAGETGALGLAILCVALGCGLIVYGLKVFRKFQELG